MILKVATRSSHLKRTFVKALKDAVTSITAVAKALMEHTFLDAFKTLQQENTRLRRELGELKVQMAELLKERLVWMDPTSLQVPYS